MVDERQHIVTLTLNPALDVSVAVELIVPNDKLRTTEPRYQPGGGGINVSRVCRRLGEATTAVVPLGGPAGQRMAELLGAELEEREVHIAPIDGDTRQSISVTSRTSGDQYRFVLPGPELTAGDVEACLDAVVDAANPDFCRCVVVSGSVPEGVDLGFFGHLVERLDHVRVVIDTSRSALSAALESGAYLVKPSARELAFLVDHDLITETDVMEAAQQVKAESNIDVLVASIGPGGAIVATDDGTFRLRAPTVRVRSTIGAGDSMVAGMAVGFQRGLELHDAVAYGVAAGTAAVITGGSDLCHSGDIDRLLPLVVDGWDGARP